MLRPVPLAHDVLHDDAELRIVSWSNVLAFRWRATPTKAKLELLGRHQRMLAESTVDRRIVVVAVIAPAASLILTGETRQQSEALVKAGREYLLGMAQVVEGEGFGAAATRAVITGIQLAVRVGYPNKVFGTVADAMPWVSDLLRKAGHERDADDVLAAVPEALGPK